MSPYDSLLQIKFRLLRILEQADTPNLDHEVLKIVQEQEEFVKAQEWPYPGNDIERARWALIQILDKRIEALMQSRLDLLKIRSGQLSASETP